MANTLPLWAYSSVGWKDGRFWATGLLIDSNPHWNPQFFKNDRLLAKKVDSFLRKNPKNRFFAKVGMSITHLSFMQCRLFGLHLSSVF
jgi:hypothetical protein